MNRCTRSGLSVYRFAIDREDRMNRPVNGPASYFPSIERKYGRPIAEWKARRLTMDPTVRSMRAPDGVVASALVS